MERVNTLARRVPVWALWAAGLVPLAWLVVQVASGATGPDPVRAVEHQLGMLGLQFLIATLCVTPLRWAGINLIRFRRALGLLSFTYVGLHLLAWGVLDMALRWPEIAADLAKRPYVLIGMVGFVAMLPLALTSSNRAIRAIGPQAWARLHRLTYLAAAAGAVHFAVQTKTWQAEPLIYAAAIAALLLIRWLRPRLVQRRAGA
jgi:methionine sulfoxide reductase heme-binding subunit